MGKIVTKLIDRFDLGIAQDQRMPNNRFARMVVNYDIHTQPYRMTPYRSSESGDSAANTSRKRNWTLALRTGTTYSLYALGIVSGDDRAEILYKDLTRGASNDLGDAGWTVPSGTPSEYQQPDGTGETAFDLFVFYRRTGLIYGARNGSHIWTFNPATPAFDNTHQALAYTSIGQGLVHSKDNGLYIPYYNNSGAAGFRSFIAQNLAGSWNTTKLTLPDHLIATSLAEYGNYLAIGCKDANAFGKSVVFLWDRDSTLPSESIDFGTGQLAILENIDGTLVGISSLSDTATENPSIDPIFLFKAYTGGPQATKFLELKSEASLNNNGSPFGNPTLKQKIDDSLYFLMDWTIYGEDRFALYRLRKNPQGGFSLSLFRTPNNDTAVTTLFSFFIVGDFVFISYDPTGSDGFALSKTSESSTYNHNADYQTVIIDGGDRSTTKKLMGVVILHQPLPDHGNSSVAVAYLVDAETSFTNILTSSTINAIRASAVLSDFPQFKELIFRIRAASSSGVPAQVTGLLYQYEEIDDDLFKH